MLSTAEALARLHQCADDGRLEAWAETHGITLLTLFGSGVHSPETAQDIDIAFWQTASPDAPDPRPGHPLGFLADLMTLLDYENIDIMDLSVASPTAKYAALAKGSLLYQREPGTFAIQQMAAFSMYFDTEHFRRLALETLAS